ncbi:hypothetical protein C9427_33060 [Mesorhizobium helmanticense]|uniref:Uncharacterized protein n=1 Tax=Mesorhizobium helmanticense TaxID=1776423 RepID=A0A2T4IKU3_9HYPH|nr:hypothetical protein C9427_33060 [Mesorhizobium helmanticense]
MDDTAIDETEKEKQMSNPHQITFYARGPRRNRPVPNRLPPLSTLAQEILMAGCDSKAHHTRLILKAQDKVLHLATRYA